MDSEIQTVDLTSRGIQTIDFDYSRIEDVYADIGYLLNEPHRHEYYEILWFTHGRGNHHIDFTEHPINPPIIFFITKNQIHQFDGSEHLKGHMLRFNEDFIWRYPEEHVIHSHGSLFGISRQPLKVSSENDLSDLEYILRLIADELKKCKDNLQKDMIYHLMHAFLIQTKRLATDYAVEINFHRRWDMAVYSRFINLMEQHYLDHYSVSQYASQIGLCTKKLTEICKSITGKSTKQVLKERILLEAKRYLRYSKYSIKEISDRLNFNDYGYFSRFFIQATQNSPTDFRNHCSQLYKK